MLQAQIFIDKDELHGSQPLFEYILRFLIVKDKRRYGVSGKSVLAPTST